MRIRVLRSAVPIALWLASCRAAQEPDAQDMTISGKKSYWIDYEPENTAAENDQDPGVIITDQTGKVLRDTNGEQVKKIVLSRVGLKYKVSRYEEEPDNKKLIFAKLWAQTIWPGQKQDTVQENGMTPPAVFLPDSIKSVVDWSKNVYTEKQYIPCHNDRMNFYHALYFDPKEKAWVLVELERAEDGAFKGDPTQLMKSAETEGYIHPASLTEWHLCDCRGKKKNTKSRS